MEKSAAKEIRNLLTLLISGVIFACIVSAGLLYYYGAMGQYRIQNVLLSPDVVSNLSFVENNTRFVFDRVEFSEYDSSARRETVQQIDLETYSEIYALLSGSANLSETEALQTRFTQDIPSVMTLYVRPERLGGQSNGQVFQFVQFIPNGKLYRVELRQEKSSKRWAYFEKEDIYKKIKQQMIPS